MAKSRIELQTLLEEILGSRNVYYQPPESIKLKYPAIIYYLNDIDVERADNGSYIKNKRYMITHINKDPDNEITDRLAELPMCSFDRRYAVDNLTHDVFTLYF